MSVISNGYPPRSAGTVGKLFGLNVINSYWGQKILSPSRDIARSNFVSNIPFPNRGPSDSEACAGTGVEAAGHW